VLEGNTSMYLKLKVKGMGGINSLGVWSMNRYLWGR